MPLTNEQLLKSINLDGKEFEDEEAFVSEFQKKFIAVDAPIPEEKKQKIIGGLLGTIETTFRRELKEFGLEPTIDKTKPLQDNVAEWMQTLRATKAAELEELKSKAGDGGDAKIQALTSEVEKYKNKFHEEKNLRTSAIAEWEQKEVQLNEKNKHIKRDFLVTKEREKAVKWKSGITELEKIGFETAFNQKYNPDIDENDNLIITDKKGNQIPNPKKAGQFLSFAEVLEMEGVGNKVWEVNPHTSKNQSPQPVRNVAAPNDNPNGPQRRVAQPMR